MLFWTAIVGLFFGALRLIAFAQSTFAAEIFMFSSTPFGLWVAAYHALWQMRMRSCLLVAQVVSLISTVILATAYSGTSSLAMLVDPGNYFLCTELWFILSIANAFTILVVFGVAHLLTKIYRYDVGALTTPKRN